MGRRKFPQIAVARVYDEAPSPDGPRILIDRLWPRGLSKQRVRLDRWAKELAPSAELRRWFGHDPGRWDEFRRRYFAELDAHPEIWQRVLAGCEDGRIVLLYGAKDSQHNNAVALKEYLEQQHRGRRPAAKRSTR